MIPKIYPERIVFIDRLQDYIDKDDLRHLNGAEKKAYQEKNLPVPSNTPLNSVYELKKVMGWAEEKKLWQNNRLIDSTTVLQKPGLNMNTIPLDALLSVPGISFATADKIIRKRPFADLYKAQREQFIYWPRKEINPLGTMSNGKFVIYLSHPSLSYQMQINLALVPAHTQGYLWIIEYIQRIRYDNRLNSTNRAALNDVKEISGFLPFTQAGKYPDTE